MEVAPGRVVTLEYTVRLASGALLDSTARCGPMSILIGAGHLLPALEDRLAGMRAGETRELRIPAEDAYGVWRPELVRVIPRDRLSPELALEVGGEYRVKAADGRRLRFRIVAIDGADVRADFNLPGAGEELTATVSVIAVRAPTADEERRGRL